MSSSSVPAFARFIHRLASPAELRVAREAGASEVGVQWSEGADLRYRDARGLSTEALEGLLAQAGAGRVWVEPPLGAFSVEQAEQLVAMGVRGVLMPQGGRVDSGAMEVLQAAGTRVMGVGFEADRDTDPDWIWGPRGTGSGAMEALVVELLPGEPGALSEFLEGHGAEADLLQVGEVADLLGASCTWLSLPPGAGEGGLRRVLSALPHAAGVFLRLGQPGPGSLGTRHMWAVGSHAEVAKLAGGAG